MWSSSAHVRVWVCVCAVKKVEKRKHNKNRGPREKSLHTSSPLPQQTNNHNNTPHTFSSHLSLHPTQAHNTIPSNPHFSSLPPHPHAHVTGACGTCSHHSKHHSQKKKKETSQTNWPFATKTTSKLNFFFLHVEHTCPGRHTHAHTSRETCHTHHHINIITTISSQKNSLRKSVAGWSACGKTPVEVMSDAGAAAVADAGSVWA